MYEPHPLISAANTMDRIIKERDDLRARVAELEEFVFRWADPCHMQGKNLDFFEEVCNRVRPNDPTKPPF